MLNEGDKLIGVVLTEREILRSTADGRIMEAGDTITRGEPETGEARMDEGKSIAGVSRSQADEERAETVGKIQAMPAIAVTLGAPLGKKEAEAVSRSLGEMRNRVDGRTVTLPIQTVGKIIDHKGFNVSTILESVVVLYETSSPAWSESEISRGGHKAHNNVESYHHYVNKFTDGTEEYFIRFTVTEMKKGKKAKQDATGENIVHSTAISNVAVYNINGRDSQSASGTSPILSESPPFIDRRLQEFFDSVKPAAQRCFQQDRASLVFGKRSAVRFA